jgi:galactose-1-phosphate uridylyltransferase
MFDRIEGQSERALWVFKKREDNPPSGIQKGDEIREEVILKKLCAFCPAE